MEKISYVNGFMIRPSAHQVLLIRKNRPAFQAGKWNGIGGKIEEGETTWAAMVREFREETGVETFPSDWEHTLTLEGRGFVVVYFRCFVHDFPAYRTTTDEQVQVWSIDAPYEAEHGHRFLDGDIIGYRCPTLDNTRWVLELQLPTQLKFPIHLKWTDQH